jgi:hypothetical protein
MDDSLAFVVLVARAEVENYFVGFVFVEVAVVELSR